MKKILRNNLLGFILGIILCIGIVYGVNLYKSEDIQYQPNDESWEINNVNDALNDLYNIKQELDNIKNLGDATADNISEGKTAVVNGELITGTLSGFKVYAIKFSSSSSRTSATVNISSYYENYSQLTIDNIIVQIGYMQDEQSGSGGSRQLSYSYNSNTGVVTITCAGQLLNPSNGTIFIIENPATYLN